MDVSAVIELILWMSESPPFKILRMIGYTSFALGLWYLVIAGFHHTNGYYFVIISKWMNLGGAVHHTVVAIWAGFIAIQVPIPNEEFTALLTITTTMMLIGFVIAFRHVIEDSK